MHLELFSAQARTALRRAQLTTMPMYAAPILAEGLRIKFHEQQETAFKQGGVGSAWPELSDWSARVRGNSEPVLVRTGSFEKQVAAFRGLLMVATESFDFVYPSPAEADGRYFGITAGQKANPLASRQRRPGPRGGTSGTHDAPIPMAQIPRPILFGEVRIAIDAQAVLHDFMLKAGFTIESGIGILGKATPISTGGALPIALVAGERALETHLGSV